MSEPGAQAARVGRRRPPLIAAAWIAVLAATVGLGLLGQAREPASREAVRVDPTRQPDRARATPVPMPPGWSTGLGPRSTPIRDLVRPAKGEDGVMGGIAFGTAWTWLTPEDPRARR